jgi:hypothetical protein
MFYYSQSYSNKASSLGPIGKPYPTLWWGIKMSRNTRYNSKSMDAVGDPWDCKLCNTIFAESDASLHLSSILRSMTVCSSTIFLHLTQNHIVSDFDNISYSVFDFVRHFIQKCSLQCWHKD